MAILECNPILRVSGADHRVLHLREPGPPRQSQRDRVPPVPTDMLVPNLPVRVPNCVHYDRVAVERQQRGGR